MSEELKSNIPTFKVPPPGGPYMNEADRLQWWRWHFAGLIAAALSRDTMRLPQRVCESAIASEALHTADALISELHDWEEVVP